MHRGIDMHRASFLLSLASIGVCAAASAAAADPITRFAVSTASDSLIINQNHTLTAEDLLVLAARDDRGLHLGWFRLDGERWPERGGDVGPAVGSSSDAAAAATTPGRQARGVNRRSSRGGDRSRSDDSPRGVRRANGGATTLGDNAGLDPLAAPRVLPTTTEPYADLAGPPVAATLSERTRQAVTRIAEIPEPSAVLLFGGGLLSLGQRIRRRRR